MLFGKVVASNVIDGKALGAELENSLKIRVSNIKKVHRPPHLVVIIVGDDPASKVYVRNKERACKRIGIDSTRVDLPSTCSPEDLENLIGEFNEDPGVDGILVQSPLPTGFDEIGITELIDPRKDVDGFHPINLGRIVTGRLGGLLPCTPSAVMKILESTGVEMKGKRALVVGRSRIVGMPTALLMAQKGIDATVTVCHSKSEDLEGLCKSSDIIVAAAGKAGMIHHQWVPIGSIIIDVGINRVEEDGRSRLVGDVEGAASTRASWITPVPGGVGPMTIAMLMSNTVTAAESIFNRSEDS